MPIPDSVDDGRIHIIPASPVANVNDDFIPSVSVKRYRWINFSVGPDAYDALLVPQWSNDGGTWATLKMYAMTTLDAGDTSSAGINGATNAVLGSFVSFQFFRVRALEYTSGSPTGFLQLFNEGLPGFQMEKTYTRVNYGDVQRHNGNVTVLESGVVTSDDHSTDFLNNCANGVKLYISPGTFGAGASNITVTIQGLDTVSNTYYDILTSAALSASTFTILKIYPGMTAASNLVANDVLPPAWRVKWQATNWGSGGSTLGISAALNA